MSTTTGAELCRGLVDDAAVFPPGLSPVGRAWRDHLELRRSGYAGCLGPLLLAPEHIAPLIAELDGSTPSGSPAVEPSAAGPPVEVALVARAGVGPVDLVAAADALRGRPHCRVVAVETTASPGWPDLLATGLPVTVEVAPSSTRRNPALARIAEARTDGYAVRAKLRTQATSSTPVPTAQELADFVAACHRRTVPFKLTGGLHHAVARDQEHGVLNVLLATHLVLGDASLSSVLATLIDPGGPRLAARALALTPEEVRDLRAAFTAYGCCGVLDPLRELIALGVLPAPDPDPDR